LHLVDHVRGTVLLVLETRDNSHAFSSVLRIFCHCDITCSV